MCKSNNFCLHFGQIFLWLKYILSQYCTVYHIDKISCYYFDTRIIIIGLICIDSRKFCVWIKMYIQDFFRNKNKNVSVELLSNLLQFEWLQYHDSFFGQKEKLEKARTVIARSNHVWPTKYKTTPTTLACPNISWYASPYRSFVIRYLSYVFFILSLYLNF